MAYELEDDYASLIAGIQSKTGKTLREIAEEAFVSRQTISNWVNAAAKPSPENRKKLREIASLWGVNVDANSVSLDGLDAEAKERVRRYVQMEKDAAAFRKGRKDR